MIREMETVSSVHELLLKAGLPLISSEYNDFADRPNFQLATMAIFAHYGKKGDVRSIYTFSPFFWSAV
jgi:hypothetical protein